MIGTISPLVQEARSQWWRSVMLYLVGSIAGGVTVIGSLAFAGELTIALLPAAARWTAVAIITSGLALREFSLVRFSLPTSHRSVPQAWWLSLGPDQGALAYGYVLGMGVSTIIPFGAFYAVAVLAFLAADLSYGVALGVTYGFARALPVVITSAVLALHSRSGPPRAMAMRITDLLNDQERLVQRVNRLAVTVFAGAATAAMVLVSWP